MRIFNQNPELVVSFSTVKDGNMGYKWGGAEAVEASRRAFCEFIGIDIKNIVSIGLIHGIDIIKPSISDAGKGMASDSQEGFEADGLITNIQGLGLSFVVADCMPVVLYDAKNKAVALLHAGRRGVEQNILSAGFQKLNTVYSTQAEDILMGVGPGIGADSYIFDTDKGVDKVFWGDDFKLAKDGRYRMDSKNKLLSQALGLGILKNHIEISPIDTYTNSNYFSHRLSFDKGVSEGRFAVVVYLKK